MTNTFRILAISLCLLLAFAADCAADGEDGGITTDLPPKAMISTPPAGKNAPVWRAEWWKEGVCVAYSRHEEGDPPRARYDFYLSDVATGRAYLATFDTEYDTVGCSVVEDFMRGSGCRRIDMGSGELEFEENSLSMPPNHFHSFNDRNLTVGYYLQEGAVVLFIFDIPMNRAYFVGYDPKDGTVGGYLIWNLRAAG